MGKFNLFSKCNAVLRIVGCCLFFGLLSVSQTFSGAFSSEIIAKLTNDKLQTPAANLAMRKKIKEVFKNLLGNDAISEQDYNALSKTYVELFFPKFKGKFIDGYKTYLEEQFSEEELGILAQCMAEQKCSKIKTISDVQKRAVELQKFAKDYGEIVGTEVGQDI